MPPLARGFGGKESIAMNCMNASLGFQIVWTISLSLDRLKAISSMIAVHRVH